MTRCIAVTGASGGVGAAVTTLLRSRGDRVIGVDLEGADVAADLSSEAGRLEAVQAIRDLAQEGLDGLVTCAGTARPSEIMPRVNYFGTTHVARELRPLLAESDAPRVALVGSIAGTDRTDDELVAALLDDDEERAAARAAVLAGGAGAHQVYPSTKAAMAQWARRTAVSPGWADAGIALNVVAPGVVVTPMSAYLFDDPAMKQVMDEAVPMPLNGYAGPEAIAAVLAFLVSVENTHVTGQVIYADGGAEATLRPASHF